MAISDGSQSRACLPWRPNAAFSGQNPLSSASAAGNQAERFDEVDSTASLEAGPLADAIRYARAEFWLVDNLALPVQRIAGTNQGRLPDLGFGD